MDKDLLTLKRAAKKLGIAKCTLYRWIQKDIILYVRLPSGSIRISQETIDSILNPTGSK
ncbi:hypothetical protein LCGC14_0986340 [marine sediment metagenome]|uniref:Helix-turn-helix domain-containing protein n=1 Tax=marine sediment metagenome TaxID=412755 RepID=A0A0F9NTK8_9ZZZZ